ncbi:MAG: YggT family protein [Clostridia bacterium]|nr:YggT family protein [Clostridia bacterium]
MDNVFYVIRTAAYIFIDALLVCMVVGAVMSWIMPDEDNKFTRVVYAITDTLTWPVRALFDRFGWFRNSPVDVPFIVTVIILALLSYACMI